MSDKIGTDTLVDQPLALRSYLDALLQAVPETNDDVTLAVNEVAPAADPALAVPPSSASAEPSTALVAAAANEVAPEHNAAVPSWAVQPFQCLLFKVGGLSLAVPLMELSGVIPWREVNAMPNRSAHFLGLLQHQGASVKVVDTTLVVMPERAQSGDASIAARRPGHILLISHGQWGLACDSIGEVLTLTAADVRWRTAKGKRPWLAGTVLQHLCAVLDVTSLTELLIRGDR